MSYHAFRMGREIAAMDFPFYSLIQAAMRRADTCNLTKLQVAFPETWQELQERYDAPAGVLPTDPERTDHAHS